MLQTIEIYHIDLPLKEPYHLSFGDLDVFSMVLVKVRSNSGREAWGECTANPGYSPYGIDDLWRASVEIAPSLPGRSVESALRALEDAVHAEPEKVCALASALETLAEPGRYNPGVAFSVPLLATVNAQNRESLRAEVKDYLAAGYGTLKVKVGFDLDADINKVRLVQEAAKGRARIRLDANQAYSEEEAAHFVRSIPPEGIELFEQPFAVDAWEATARLQAISPLPVMLDESIHGEAELERAIRERCCAFVKFKLTKAGSLRRLERLIRRALEARLKVVAGNGVAGETGCAAEAAVLAAHPCSAGENNGFAKLASGLYSSPLNTGQGRLLVPGNFQQGMDAVALDRRRVRHEVFG